MEKLVKTLRKEFARNKKKSLVLGLISVVALYFWAPLVWTWVGGESKSDAPRPAATPTAPAPAMTAQPSATPRPAAGSQAAPMAWNVLQQQRSGDAMTRSVAYDTPLGNPFDQGESTAEDNEEPDDRPPVVGTANPTDLGLRLAGTMLGRIRTATINNKTYRQSDRVVVGSGPKAVEYWLAEVHQRHVVLQRDGISFPLEMEELTLDGDWLIQPSNSSD